MIIYKKHFIVSGTGEDDISQITAFDRGLIEAGISESNLVRVSSILPEDSIDVGSNPGITIGEVVHCVMARMDGVYGQRISAGIARVIGRRGGKRYGLVVEFEGNLSEDELQTSLRAQINKMCEVRNFIPEDVSLYTKSIDKITKKFGCVLVALVYR